MDRCSNVIEEKDLWEHLCESEKKIVLYGMGNGADKVFSICDRRKIPVADVFASDGFVRGHSFHGIRVKTWSEIKELYGSDGVIVLLCFATTLPSVMENVRKIASEAELYAPDVPVFGDGLFDGAYAREHRAQLEAVAEMLSDELSVRVFWDVVAYRISGSLAYLEDSVCEREEILENVLLPQKIRRAMDLGAYNGDSVRSLLSEIRAAGGSPERIWAMEPDARNFRKLSEYASTESLGLILPTCAAAWSHEEILTFDGSGNRNASVGENRSTVLATRPMKVKEVLARAPDEVLGGASVDYIKYDVEGSEMEALAGSCETIRSCAPTLAVSLYHRVEDLWKIPLYLRKRYPFYRHLFLRRPEGIPAWDLMLYCRT